MGPFPFSLLFHIVRGLLATWLLTRGLPWLARHGWAWVEAHAVVAVPSTRPAPPPAPLPSIDSHVSPRSAPLPDPHTAGDCTDCGGEPRLRLARSGRWEAACRVCGRAWARGAVPAPGAAPPAR